MFSWEGAVHDFYKPLKSVKGWRRCPVCREFPRVWVFDNGNYAKCRCEDRWTGGVSAEDIMSAVHNRHVDYSEWKDYLMRAWNKHVEDLKSKTQEVK